MIKTLDKLFSQNYKSRTEFLLGCIISEKISAFYFHVRILSESKVRFYKSNHQEILQEDIILNSIWKKPIDDFTKIFFSNPEFTGSHIGYTFSFFYFPVRKPLHITYRDGFDYILSYVEDGFGKYVDPEWFDFHAMNGRIKKYGIVLRDACRTDDERKAICKFKNSKEAEDYIIHRMVGDFDCRSLSVGNVSDAEGLILRYKGENFQIIMNPPKADAVSDNRLALEFVIHDFAKFLREEKDIGGFVSGNYCISVCRLFEAYMAKMSLKPYNMYGIHADDLKAPNFGYYGGTCIDLIPLEGTRKLCTESSFAENIFKILLNGLRKRRKYSSSLAIIQKKDIDVWNECVGILDSNRMGGEIPGRTKK